MICSMVEENGQIPDDRKAAVAYAEDLQEKVFPHLKVACVHGRMKPREKEKVMAAFAGGEIQILVSGLPLKGPCRRSNRQPLRPEGRAGAGQKNRQGRAVDVPNATVMVVEDADRFGLSQLHQLRGRA